PLVSTLSLHDALPICCQPTRSPICFVFGHDLSRKLCPPACTVGFFGVKLRRWGLAMKLRTVLVVLGAILFAAAAPSGAQAQAKKDRKSTRLNSSHSQI